MSSKKPPLTDTEDRIYNKLLAFREVKIKLLFRAAFRRWPEPGQSNRVQQQRLGFHFANLNRKLKPYGQRVAPGEARGTYTITKI